MPYITSVEEIGFERGHQAGRQEGERSLVVRLLTRRVGALPKDLQSQVEAPG
jgi:predicted transposase YdaD